MPPVRRFLGAVAAALVVVCVVAVPPPAAAQNAVVTLRLDYQSPWSSQQFRGALDLVVAATNNGSETLRTLELQVSFGEPISTQAEFDAMLSTGVATQMAVSTKTIHGSIDPGKTMSIPMTVDLKSIAAIDHVDSQVYPASISLLSEDSLVATTVTPVIYLVPTPEKPILSSVAVPLSAPIAFGADDALVDTTFPSSLGEGGPLRETLNAIAGSASARHPRGIVDLITDPMVITQAHQVAAGYRTIDGTQVPADSPQAAQASRFLAELTSVVGATNNVETVAEPFGNPNIPSMLATYSGFPAGQTPATLETELDAQRASASDVLSTVNATPSSRVFAPSGADFNDETLDWLARSSLDVALGSADTVDRSPWQGTTAPAPTVPTGAGPTLVLPDPNAQALFGRTDLLADPVRAAQMVLGELAFIWKQEPVPDAPTQRGVAIAPPSTLPPDMWAPLLDRLAGAPFLKPVSLSQLVDQVSPDNPNGAGPLTAPSSARFVDTYAADIARLGSDVSIVNSMLGPGSEEPTDLRRRLFTATEPTYLADPASGQPWLSSVDGTVSQAFDAVTPVLDPRSRFTLTSHEGTIPLQMGDPGDSAYHVTLELRSQDFTFPEGDQQNVVVDQPGEVVSFRVIANNSGQNSLYLQVKDPNGRLVPVNDGTTTAIAIAVRTTAVNSIALLVTVLAALALVGLYARRWFRRRTNPT